jgi:hypothetical protein|tara:strand:+ start:653 stop:1108 length:456 start_codon:yes stop_codon:yes gene_type:complete
MFKKTFFLILFSLIISSCGYVSVYKGAKDVDYKISIMELSGDRDMGILINSKLDKYSEKETGKNFKIKINTTYNKNIIAKDTTGKATDYQIKVVATFNVESEIFNKQIKITESFNVKGLDDKFEEQRYDSIIKGNIANAIIRKLTMQLSRN